MWYVSPFGLFYEVEFPRMGLLKYKGYQQLNDFKKYRLVTFQNGCAKFQGHRLYTHITVSSNSVQHMAIIMI